MKLKIGKMTSKELAEWMGIKYPTYRKNIKGRLEYLKHFAEFEEIYGGVIITKIYIEEFVKNISDDDTFFNNEIDRCVKEQEGFASLAGIANIAKKEEEYKDLSDSQIRRRMSSAGKRNYGKYGDPIGGMKGIREREWAIKIDDYNHYRPLSEEEYNTFLEITSAFYTSDPEKIIEKKKLEEQLRDDEITKERYFELIDAYELDHFSGIYAEFAKRTGKQISLATQYTNRAWEEIKNEE